MAARAGILLKNLLDMEGFVEPAAYWVHRLNALQLGNTSLHTCNGFFGFINRVLLLIQVILALLGSKRRNVAALTTIKTVVIISPLLQCRVGGVYGLPGQFFPQGIRHKFGLIQLAECVAFRHGNHVRIRHAGG